MRTWQFTLHFLQKDGKNKNYFFFVSKYFHKFMSSSFLDKEDKINPNAHICVFWATDHPIILTNQTRV